MVVFPPCKINVGLHVLYKRNDGYHELDTCFYPIPFTDILEILPADQFSLTISGSNIEGKIEENLCTKAFRLIQTNHHIPNVAIHLYKILPTGAGLGGGSADAAYTLLTLNQLFDLKLKTEELAQYAAQLGSDCAFFCYQQPMIGKGRGEILEPSKSWLKNYYLVLMKPAIHVSTALAYQGIQPRNNRPSIESLLALPIEEWKNVVENDFEKGVFAEFPAIQKIKEFLYEEGAIYAAMSGSGSSVFGIFADEPNGKIISHPDIIWSGWLTA